MGMSRLAVVVGVDGRWVGEQSSDTGAAEAVRRAVLALMDAGTGRIEVLRAAASDVRRDDDSWPTAPNVTAAVARLAGALSADPGARATLVLCGVVRFTPVGGLAFACAPTDGAAGDPTLQSLLTPLEVAGAGRWSLVLEAGGQSASGREAALRTAIPDSTEIWPGGTGYSVFAIRDAAAAALGWMVATGPDFPPGNTGFSAGSEHWHWFAPAAAFPSTGFRLAYSTASLSSLPTTGWQVTPNIKFAAENGEVPNAGANQTRYRMEKIGGNGSTPFAARLLVDRNGAVPALTWYARDEATFLPGNGAGRWLRFGVAENADLAFLPEPAPQGVFAHQWVIRS